MKELHLERLRIDGGTQPRTSINMLVVAEYAEDLERGDTFPPVLAVFDGKDYWLYDGFHRYHGHQQAKRTTIKVEVIKGTVEDARWLALAANKAHGQRRTNEDKRRAVEQALKMRPKESDYAVAEHVGVSAEMVRQYRQRLPTVGSEPERTGRDGRTINVSNIGKRPEPPPVPTVADLERQLAAEGRLFVCPCGETFDAEVWHCPICAHHWPMSRDDCWNCHQAKRRGSPVAENVTLEDSEYAVDLMDYAAEPEPEPVPRPKLEPPSPRYPHSDRLYSWLRTVSAQTEFIHIKLGGIKALLAEPDKWDWEAVRGYILLVMESVEKTIAEYRKELERALRQRNSA